MAANKTVETESSVDDFLDAAEPVHRRAEGRALADLMARVTGAPARMWGPSIVGFGRYTYLYASGRPGEWCRLGFSPRKAKLVLYLPGVVSGKVPGLDQLGKHSTGKGCLYLARLDHADPAVLEALVAGSWARMAAEHP